jgi:hypothetical protein
MVGNYVNDLLKAVNLEVLLNRYWHAVRQQRLRDAQLFPVPVARLLRCSCEAVARWLRCGSEAALLTRRWFDSR